MKQLLLITLIWFCRYRFFDPYLVLWTLYYQDQIPIVVISYNGKHNSVTIKVTTCTCVYRVKYEVADNLYYVLSDDIAENI